MAVFFFDSCPGVPLLSETIISMIFIGAGLVGLYFSARSILNPEFARIYAETGPKAWLGRRAFGAENLSSLNRRLFLPLGVVISSGLILIGIYLW
jgi:hypothetical protein